MSRRAITTERSVSLRSAVGPVLVPSDREGQANVRSCYWSRRARPTLCRSTSRSATFYDALCGSLPPSCACSRPSGRRTPENGTGCLLTSRLGRMSPDASPVDGRCSARATPTLSASQPTTGRGLAAGLYHQGRSVSGSGSMWSGWRTGLSECCMSASRTSSGARPGEERDMTCVLLCGESYFPANERIR